MASEVDVAGSAVMLEGAAIAVLNTVRVEEGSRAIDAVGVTSGTVSLVESELVGLADGGVEVV